MKPLFVALAVSLGILVVLSSCQYVGLAKQKGAEFYDAALAESEWFMCYAASIGSVKRRYGAEPERAKTYNALCSQTGASELITGPAVPE